MKINKDEAERIERMKEEAHARECEAAALAILREKACTTWSAITRNSTG